MKECEVFLYKFPSRSSPLSYIKYSLYFRVAQLVEQLAVNQWVVGSSPTAGAMPPWCNGNTNDL